MRNTTTTVVIAAGLVLAAVIVSRTPGQQAVGTSAGSGGDPCPADLDGDANVGIVDFLQLLAAWGPCPQATVVCYAKIQEGTADPKLTLRLWSDNTLEISNSTLDPGGIPGGMDLWWCTESFPNSGQWGAVEAPPAAPNALPVDIWVRSSGGQHSGSVAVGYNDGEVYVRDWQNVLLEGCDLPNADQHYEFQWVTEWVPFSEPLP